MIRTTISWIVIAVLVMCVASADAANRNNRNKNNRKKNTKKDNSAQILKQVNSEISRVNAKIKAIAQARDAAEASLRATEAELERLKSERDSLGTGSEGSTEKTQLARKIHGAVGDVKESQKKIAGAAALLAQGRAYLSKLEAKQKALSKKKKK